MANKKQDIVEREDAPLPVNQALLDEIDQDLGQGVSTDAADNLVPLIYVLHPLSPQVLDGPAHIEGARGGDIWLKNFSEDPIVKGKDGIWFQPCIMYQKWTEWIPRTSGGGFVASYDYNNGKLPEGAVRDSSDNKRPRFVFPDSGHDCIDTRYEAGLYWRNGMPFPYVIPFKSTGHAISRGWMTKRTSLLRRVGNGKSGIWPSWSHVYKLTTSMHSNNMGQWYLFDIGQPEFYMPGIDGKPYQTGYEVIGRDPDTAYRMGKALNLAFASGAKQEEAEVSGAQDEGVDQRDMSPQQQKALDDNIPY